MANRLSVKKAILIVATVFTFGKADGCMSVTTNSDGTATYTFSQPAQPAQPSIACDAKCGCADGGHATEYAYCMAKK